MNNDPTDKPQPEIRQAAQQHQSGRLTAIKVYNSNRNANCIDIVTYLLKQEDKSFEERQEKYRVIALVASVLGFSYLINAMNGMKSQLKDPYTIGLAMVLNRIEQMFTAYNDFFDHSNYFIAAYRELINRTFEADQRMRDNISQIFDAYTNREQYEERKSKRSENPQGTKEPPK